MTRYTCFDCTEVVECPHCEQEMETEGTTYDLDDFPLEQQALLIIDGVCCVCGSFRVEQ